MLFYYDFECQEGHIFEELQEQKDNTALPCPRCGLDAKRIISGTRLDPKMGLTQDFPSMAAKWERKTRARARNDKLTDNPNLWMY